MNKFIEILKAGKAEKMGKVVLKQEIVEEPKPVKKPRKKKSDGN
jgi:hypothetical protein